MRLGLRGAGLRAPVVGYSLPDRPVSNTTHPELPVRAKGRTPGRGTLTGSPERPAIRMIHPEISDIAFYFEHNRISKILRLDQSKRAKSVVGKSRPRICEKCTDFSGLASLLPFPLPLSFHTTARAALAAPPRHLRSWIGQHARFEPGEAASHTAVRRHARLPARPPCA